MNEGTAGQNAAATTPAAEAGPAAATRGRAGGERGAAHILERIADAHVAFDRSLRYVAVNAAAERAFGRPRGAILGRTLTEAFPEAAGSESERQYRRVAAEGVAVHFTEHYVGDGFDVHVEVDAYPTDAEDGASADGGGPDGGGPSPDVRDGGGGYGVAVLWRDVTARVAAERALRAANAALEARNAELRDQAHELEHTNQQLQEQAAELEATTEELQATAAQLEEQIQARDDALGRLSESDARFRQIAENVREVFWLTGSAEDRTAGSALGPLSGPPGGPQAALLYVSPAFADVWGRPVDVLRDNAAAFLDGIHPEDRPRVLAAWPAQPAGDYDVEYRVVRPDGSERWVRDRAFPVRAGGPAGRVVRIAGVAEDVTARVVAEAAERVARARTERLQALAAALSAARTPGEVARATLAAGGDALGLRRGSVYAVEDGGAPGDTLALVDALGYDAATRARWARIPNTPATPAGDAVARRVPVVVGRRAVLAARYPALRPFLETTRYVGTAVFPLIVGPAAAPPASASVLGFVGFDFDEERELGPADVEFLGALAQLCAQALERARLYEAEHVARETAEAERAQLARLVDALPVLVTLYDPALAASPAGAVQFNRAFVDALGWTADDARAGDLMADCYPDPAVRARAAAHMQAPNGGWLELPTRAKDGRVVPVLWTNVTLAGDRQVGVGVDLTDRQAAEDALRRARDAAEAANQAKSDFLATMSHELRTPLNAIGGYAQLLEMELHGPVTEDQRRALARVQGAQRHLLGIVNDVLNYAKLEIGRVEFDLRATRVADVVRDVTPLVAPQLAAKGLTFDVALPDTPEFETLDAPGTGALGRVWADPEKLGQVLLNLLANAAKFTPSFQADGAPGRVTLTLGPRDGSPDIVELRVADTGIGVPAAKQAAIFEPFVQVRTGYTREHEGTGLGLAISRDLARGMGGELTVESTEGAGATFVVALRRVVAADGEPTDRRSAYERRRSDERRSGVDRRLNEVSDGNALGRSDAG